VSRSAIERVRLVRAALEQVAIAESLAASDYPRAMLRVVRGQTLQQWGFPLDGLTAFHSALELEPALDAARRRETELAAAIRAGR